LDSAILFLTKSLRPGSWIDEIRLVVARGGYVFAKHAETVLLLNLLETEGAVSTSTLHNWQERIVKSDRLLAVEQMLIAASFGETSEHLERIQLEITKGDRAAVNHRTSAAIMHYSLAWHLATARMDR
jgi:hypothetical protein